jgi:hypothetical protein
MRRVAVPVLSALLLLAAPHPAAAGPARDLCRYDDARGGVPAGFVLEACVENAAVTLRNNLDVAVLVQTDGNVGNARRRTISEGAVGAIVRAAADEGGVVLMPGDVARWPIAGAPGDWTVRALRSPLIPAIAETLVIYLPVGPDGRPGGADREAFTDLAGAVSAAVTARRDCVRGTNFLVAAACDVDASAAIALAVADHVPPVVAETVTPAVLDPGTWADWSSAAAGPRLPDGGEPRLHQTARG